MMIVLALQAQELEAKLKYIQETVPTKVYNVSSSSAGAGSGDFHQYRIVRQLGFKGVHRSSFPNKGLRFPDPFVQFSHGYWFSFG